MPAIRTCHRTQAAANAEQRLFALYLPGAELTLHAAVDSAAESERAVLMESLLERGLLFVMRCDNNSG